MPPKINGCYHQHDYSNIPYPRWKKLKNNKVKNNFYNISNHTNKPCYIQAIFYICSRIENRFDCCKKKLTKPKKQEFDPKQVVLEKHLKTLHKQNENYAYSKNNRGYNRISIKC